MHKSVRLVLVSTTVFLSCQDFAAPDLDSLPSAQISDAVHDGREGFYFLPPLVRRPRFSGEFDPDFLPFLRVVVCEWIENACGAEVASFTSEEGTGGRVLQIRGRRSRWFGASHDDKDDDDDDDDDDGARVHRDQRFYQVLWRTRRSDLDPDKAYRIRVLADEAELGFADLDVVSSRREFKNVNTGEFVTLKNGRTLPIKFRVTDELMGAAVVSAAGGVVTSADGNATVSVPAGALSSDAALVVERVDAPIALENRVLIGATYSVALVGGSLLSDVSVQVAGPVATLIAPEVWVLRDGEWSFLAPSAVAADHIEVAVDRFSTFGLYAAAILSTEPDRALGFGSDFVSDGTYGIGPVVNGSLNGWVSNTNVDFVARVLRVSSTHDCTGRQCAALRGAGAAIRTSQLGYGLFNAQVRFDVARSTRYAVFLFNGDMGPSLQCNDEATIEIDYENSTWSFRFTTWRMEQVPIDCSKDPVKTFDSGKIILPGFDPSAVHTLSIDRRATSITASLDGQQKARTTARLPSGKMRMMLNVWAPTEFSTPVPADAGIYELVDARIGSETPGVPASTYCNSFTTVSDACAAIQVSSRPLGGGTEVTVRVRNLYDQILTNQFATGAPVTSIKFNGPRDPTTGRGPWGLPSGLTVRTVGNASVRGNGSTAANWVLKSGHFGPGNPAFLELATPNLSGSGPVDNAGVFGCDPGFGLFGATSGFQTCAGVSTEAWVEFTFQTTGLWSVTDPNVSLLWEYTISDSFLRVCSGAPCVRVN